MKNAKLLFFILMSLCMYYISICTIMEKHIFEGICYFIVGLIMLTLGFFESETEN
jgi:hypothetical protein